jgi:hypothetical protein
MTGARYILPALALLLTLTACDFETIRAPIREWCEDTPDWCNRNAVK